MRILPTPLNDAWLIELDVVCDERGSFARTFCAQEFAGRGLETAFVQHSQSRTSRKGSIRGMHLQREPHAEVKVVRCLRGAIWDVLVDLRPHSPTYLKWAGFELTERNERQLYTPKGFAHGFQTLSDDVELSYLISANYTPAAATGFSFDDPAFAIAWPLPVTVINERDRSWPPFDGWAGA